jgi:Ni/Fe-hydrogenase subunit HybB-like protein
MENFLFPNETVLEWDLLIVIYPYITGLVAGAFIVSSLYHVFGLTKLKPVARFSLVTALAFLLVAPLPLILHLGRPERALEMFLRPNFSSAMSGFGFIWMLYLVLVLAEVWLVFRPDIIRYAQNSSGIKKTIYSLLALGIYDLSEKSLAADKKLIKVLAFIGIPAAALLHGYVGFIFGAIKANPWWSTPLMPIIFLVSAIVSGIALLIILYVIVTRIRGAKLDLGCVNTMALWLGGFLTAAIVIEGLEILSRSYESEESWAILSQLITQKLAVSYVGIQYLFGMLLPILMLGAATLLKLKQGMKLSFQLLAGIAILIGVFAMRWNVVIGGQLVSKSLRGLSSYTPPLYGLNGVITSLIILILPLIIFGIISYLIPIWQEEAYKENEQYIQE